MILAAGRGNRMRPLTDHIPKPLLTVNGKALIVYLLETLSRAGYQRVVINLSYRGTQIREFLGDGRQVGIPIEYSTEGDTPLETGGAIRHALHRLGTEPFLVINGDIFTDYPFTLPPPLADQDLAHLVLVDNPPHHPSGDFALTLRRLHEGNAARLTFAGIGWYRPALFADLTPGIFPLAPILRRAIAAGRISGSHYRGRWTDVGTPERLAELQDESQQLRYTLR